jgi:hypothetical protein
VSTTYYARVRSRAGWLVWTLALSLVFGRIAAFNLGNYRPVTNDEVELMTVGYKLATRGVLGSDLYTGFFGADQHYMITLPLQQLLESISFRLFGPGVAQARWVSLIAGGSILWSVGWLAYRWHGLLAAIVCELLLVAWASNLTGAANGLPLFGVARAARYDVLAVAFAWLAIALLDATRCRARRGGGFTIGVCCGLATLSTFIGAFVVPVVALNWLWARRRSDGTLLWTIAGFALLVVPWTAYCLIYRADFASQLAVYGQRWSVFQPGFYVQNVVTEPARYQNLFSVSNASTWLLAIGIWPALAYVIWRARAPGTPGDRLVWSSLVIFAALLVLVDQTKTPLYAIVLLPSVCLALAALISGIIGWAWRHGSQPQLRIAATALSLLLAVAVGTDTNNAYQQSLRQAAEAGAYLSVGQQIDRGLPPGARVLGPERWWWALHEHPYSSLRSVWFQWTAQAASGATPSFSDWIPLTSADSIVVNDNVRGDIQDFSETLQQQFWTFLSTCTTQVVAIDDPTYLQIEVYAITHPVPPGCPVQA